MAKAMERKKDEAKRTKNKEGKEGEIRIDCLTRNGKCSILSSLLYLPARIPLPVVKLIRLLPICTLHRMNHRIIKRRREAEFLLSSQGKRGSEGTHNKRNGYQKIANKEGRKQY